MNEEKVTSIASYLAREMVDKERFQTFDNDGGNRTNFLIDNIKDSPTESARAFDIVFAEKFDLKTHGKEALGVLIQMWQELPGDIDGMEERTGKMLDILEVVIDEDVGDVGVFPGEPRCYSDDGMLFGSITKAAIRFTAVLSEDKVNSFKRRIMDICAKWIAKDPGNERKENWRILWIYNHCASDEEIRQQNPMLADMIRPLKSPGRKALLRQDYKRVLGFAAPHILEEEQPAGGDAPEPAGA